MGNFIIGAVFGIIVSSLGLTTVASYIDSGVGATKEFIEQRVDKQ